MVKSPLSPLETPPAQQGVIDHGQNLPSSKSKLATLMTRFSQLKKSDRKSEAGRQDREEEAWARPPEVLTLGDDDDDDMVCMRSPSVSPLPKR